MAIPIVVAGIGAAVAALQEAAIATTTIILTGVAANEVYRAKKDRCGTGSQRCGQKKSCRRFRHSRSICRCIKQSYGACPGRRLLQAKRVPRAERICRPRQPPHELWISGLSISYHGLPSPCGVDIRWKGFRWVFSRYMPTF